MEYFQWGINTKMSVIAILTAEEGKWFIAYEIAETNTFRDNSCPFKVFFFFCFRKQNSETMSYISLLFHRCQLLKGYIFLCVDQKFIMNLSIMSQKC